MFLLTYLQDAENMTGMKFMTWVIRDPIYRSKGQTLAGEDNLGIARLVFSQDVNSQWAISV